MIRKIMTMCGACLLVVAASVPAHASEITLGKGGSTVFVWKDGDAMSEGFKLIQAGVHKSNPMLVIELLSCAVPAGTKAIITDGGFATQTILVTDGESVGCRGDVVTEDVNRM